MSSRTSAKPVRSSKSGAVRTKPKGAVSDKASAAQSKAVKLYEIDPNSGPVDVPHKVCLYGQNIDPTRVKAKFGAAPSVFLQQVATVRKIPLLLLLPLLPLSDSFFRNLEQRELPVQYHH